jgi:hypothetical protein
VPTLLHRARHSLLKTCRNKAPYQQNLDLAINGKIYRGAPIAAVRGSRLWVGPSSEAVRDSARIRLLNARIVRASEPRMTGQACAWADGVDALRAREITTRAEGVNGTLAEFAVDW